MSDYIPMGTVTPIGAYVPSGGAITFGEYAPMGPASPPPGSTLVYTGGTATPNGWSAVGGVLQYDGTTVLAQTSCTEFYTTFTGELDGELDVHLLTSLVILECYNNSLTSLILPNAPLAAIFANLNALTSVTMGSVADACDIELADNALPESEVDGVLVALAGGTAINGRLVLTGGTNATPSATGLSAKATLEGRGWTVIVN